MTVLVAVTDLLIIICPYWHTGATSIKIEVHIYILVFFWPAILSSEAGIGYSPTDESKSRYLLDYI